MLLRKSVFPGMTVCENNTAVMEKSVPNSDYTILFRSRENQLIGYNFLIGDTRKYKAFP